MINRLWILSIFCITGLLLRIYQLNIGLGFSDELVLFEAAKLILKDPKNLLRITVILVHAPLYFTIFPFFSLLSSPLFEPSILLLRYISAGVGTVFIIIIYHTIKKQIGKPEAIVSSVLLAITGYFVALSRIAYPDIFVILIFAIFILYFMKFIEDITLKTSIYYGLSLTFVILLKEPAVLMIPSTIIFLLWDKNWKVLKNKYFWLGSTLPVILAAPIVLYCIYAILPEYLPGIDIWEFPAFYQAYLGRGMHIQNIIPNTFAIFHNFALYSSLPVTILFLSGVGYGMYRREKLDKYLLCTITVFLIFFSAMGRPIPISEYGSYISEYGMAFVDWHTKWIFLPMLILTATSIVRVYSDHRTLLGKKKIRLFVFIAVLVSVAYVVWYDLSIINAMNEYMSENLKLIPLMKHDPRAEEVAAIFG